MPNRKNKKSLGSGGKNIRRPSTRDASTSTRDLQAESADELHNLEDLTYKSLMLLVFSLILNRRVRREEETVRMQRATLSSSSPSSPPRPPPPPPTPPQPSLPTLARTEVVALYVVNTQITRKCFFCNANTTNVCGRCLQTPFCNCFCHENGFPSHEQACELHLSRARAARAAPNPRVAPAPRTARIAHTARAQPRNVIPLGE